MAQVTQQELFNLIDACIALETDLKALKRALKKVSSTAFHVEQLPESIRNRQIHAQNLDASIVACDAEIQALEEEIQRQSMYDAEHTPLAVHAYQQHWQDRLEDQRTTVAFWESKTDALTKINRQKTTKLIQKQEQQQTLTHRIHRLEEAITHEREKMSESCLIHGWLSAAYLPKDKLESLSLSITDLKLRKAIFWRLGQIYMRAGTYASEMPEVESNELLGSMCRLKAYYYFNEASPLEFEPILIEKFKLAMRQLREEIFGVEIMTYHLKEWADTVLNLYRKNYLYAALVYGNQALAQQKLPLSVFETSNALAAEYVKLVTLLICIYIDLDDWLGAEKVYQDYLKIPLFQREKNLFLNVIQKALDRHTSAVSIRSMFILTVFKKTIFYHQFSEDLNIPDVPTPQQNQWLISDQMLWMLNNRQYDQVIAMPDTTDLVDTFLKSWAYLKKSYQKRSPQHHLENVELSIQRFPSLLEAWHELSVLKKTQLTETKGTTRSIECKHRTW